MTRRSGPRWSICVLAIGLAAQSAGGDVAGSAELTRQLRKLSLDVRNTPVTAAELADARTQLASSSADAVYARFAEAWIDADFAGDQALLGKVLTEFEPGGGGPLFFTLSAFRAADGRDVLYLPRKNPDASAPCAAADIVTIRPWWRKQPVAICSASYVPDVSIVDGTFCPQALDNGGGYSVPAACGCGPRLMHCAPPEDQDAALAAAIKDGPTDEVRHTSLDLLVKQHRPLEELYTTSRTWQNGLVRFLYARREATRLVAGGKLTPQIAAKIDALFDPIDAHAKPGWVERGGPYVGTGVWFTPPLAVETTYRNTIREIFNVFFCVDYGSVNVDRDALLSAVGDQVQNLRSLNAITDSPMRHQDGCNGCHMPMDTTAGFLFQFELSWRGGFARAAPPPAELYLRGATDRRGAGLGIAGLMKLIIAQPEFESCAVQKVFGSALERGPLSSERPQVDALVDGFRAHHHDLVWLVKQMFTSAAYRMGT